MATTIRQAEALVERALRDGFIVTSRAYSGEGTVTAGPYYTATGRNPRYAGFWYKRRQESIEHPYPGDVAAWFVARVGRGNARKAVERAR